MKLYFSIACALLIMTKAGAQSISFPHVFAPQEGLTKPVEQPWRQEICLNGSWRFQPVALPGNFDIKNGTPLLPLPDSSAWSSTPIRIPSPWNVNAFTYTGGDKTFPSYPEEWEKARMGWLRRSFRIPDEWEKDKRIILHFEAICGAAQVYINGEQVAAHFDNSLPLSVDITDFVKKEDDNVLLVGVRHPTLMDVPGWFGSHTYPSGSPWTRQMAGIWQDVFLRALPALRVEEIFVKPKVDSGMLEIELTIRNSTGMETEFEVSGEILPWINQAGTDIISAPEPKWTLGSRVLSMKSATGKIGPRTTMNITIRQSINNELKSWTPETPNLYALLFDISRKGITEDKFYQRFGWRQWGIKGRDVTLNGKVYQLLGESGHLLGLPYMTRRYAWSWYKAMKDMNGNAIRLHANIRPRFYLELADEMGMAILEESEIYASTMEINYNEPITWLRFQDHLANMVRRDRNHPSIFGWSIANEILSALWWKGMPRKFWPPVLDKVVALADLVKQADPTRPWISSDGDGDFHGRLPTYIYHYGKPQDWNRQAPKDKPFGIGEGGSMLWGSPAVFSTYNGERSYESRRGMQEGTAIEIYWYLTEQRKISAFTSIFTAAGSCFEPLQLGIAKPNTLPTSRDGIVFGPFKEGQPGIQPERLGAWATHFNPGYDPAQPLYKTTPVFDAVKAAYAPGAPAPSVYDHRVSSTPRPAASAASIQSVEFIGSTDSDLKKALESAGITVTSKSSLLVIDGSAIDETKIASVKKQMAETLKRKGTVFIWISPQNLSSANQLLPAPIELVPQSTFGLFANRNAPETAPIALADLYFADQSDRVILKNGLSGALVEQSRKLITANSFGQRWNMTLDEPKSAALIAVETGGGRLIVTSLTPDVRSEKRLKLMRSLFANTGVALSAPSDKYNTGFDGAGYLNQALVLGSFQGMLYPEILDKDFIGNEFLADPKPGDAAGNRRWTMTRSLGDGLFDFFRIGIPGTEGSRVRSQGPVLKPEALDANNYLEVIERVSGTNPGTNSVVYISFYIHSPVAADAAALTMQMRTDDGAKVWVNTKPVFEERKIYGPGLTDPKPVPLALNEGWNHVLVKVGQLDGPWNFAVRFESKEPGLVEKLRASALKPVK